MQFIFVLFNVFLVMIKRENNISTKTDTNNQNNGDDFEHKDLSLTINPLKRSALEIRNNHRMILSRVDGSGKVRF